MIKDFVLCARAVEKNKLLVELEPSFSLLATRSSFVSPEHLSRLLAHLHNRKAIGEPFQNQRRIDLDSPDVRTVPSHQFEDRIIPRITRSQKAALALLSDTSQSIVSQARSTEHSVRRSRCHFPSSRAASSQKLEYPKDTRFVLARNPALGRS